MHKSAQVWILLNSLGYYVSHYILIDQTQQRTQPSDSSPAETPAITTQYVSSLRRRRNVAGPKIMYSATPLRFSLLSGVPQGSVLSRLMSSMSPSPLWSTCGGNLQDKKHHVQQFQFGCDVLEGITLPATCHPYSDLDHIYARHERKISQSHQTGKVIS